MDFPGRGGTRARKALRRGMPLLPAVALAALLVLPALSAPAAPAPAKNGGVKLKVRSAGQDGLLGSGRLAVRVSAPGGTKLSLVARQGKAGGLVRRKTVRFAKRGRRTVKLRLTAKGRKAFGTCGPQLVTVEGRYRGGGEGEARRLTARASRKLKAGQSKCILDVDAPNAGRCDPIDPVHCLAPFPNDYFTAPDAASATGRRVSLSAASMPKNTAGVPIDPAEYNRNDGFSPNSPIMTRVPGVNDQAAFEANGFVAQTAIGEYARPDQPIVLIDAVTGQRHPIWAELDETPVVTNANRLLIARPAEALEPGRRYVVALRGLTTTSGAPLEPASPIFKAYRDKVRTDDATVEARRPKMESLFATLAAAGIPRSELFLAWDFTISSEQSLTGRLRSMRDDAFAQLGDTDLADSTIDGASPDITVTEVTSYALCSASGGPECAEDESNYAHRRIRGTVEVPCYMDAQSALATPPGAPLRCGPGSRLTYAPGTQTPVQSGGATFDAPFTCLLPREAEGDADPAGPKPPTVYGHGLLGSDRSIEPLRLYPASLATVICATPWIGMSSSDLTGFLPQVLTNLARFPALVDRSQQGMLDMLYLARAMAHPAGFAGELDFAGTIDTTSGRVGFLGASQGGIFGGAATAVAPDWDNALLGVPGMGFSTLITRSTQFNQFLPLVNTFYTDPVERQIGYSLLQSLWDRGETGGYVHGMTGEPFGGETPPHKVVLLEAFGDHQVTNIQTESEARTIDAVVRAPVLEPGRSPDLQPLWNIPREPSASFTAPGGYGGDAVLYVMDTGPIRVEDWDGDGDTELVGTNPNPISNTAPVDGTGLAPAQWFDGLDPHEPVASSPQMQAIALPFLQGTAGVIDPCLASGVPVPCAAPPIHVLGEGL